MRQTMEQQMADYRKRLETARNETIALFPTAKSKGYMGENIVILDFNKSDWATAFAVSESMDKTDIRVTTFPAKNRIAITF
jgi:hypothetical protein